MTKTLMMQLRVVMGAVTDTEATQNETVTTTTYNSVPARRHPDRVRRPPEWYQTDSYN